MMKPLEWLDSLQKKILYKIFSNVFSFQNSLSIIFLMVHFASHALCSHSTDVTGEAVSQMNRHCLVEGALISTVLDIISTHSDSLN